MEWIERIDCPVVKFASSSNNSDIQIHYAPILNEDGSQNFIDYGEAEVKSNPNTGVMYNCAITLNRSMLVNLETDMGFFKAITCHEFGHALGLNHNSQGAQSIMLKSAEWFYDPEADSPKNTNPFPADINPINSLYSAHATYTYSQNNSNYSHVRTCANSDCDYQDTEMHTWRTNTSGTYRYRCIKCGYQTNIAPISPIELPDSILHRLRQYTMTSEFAIELEDGTILCHINGQYYLVKGGISENAVEYVKQNITHVRE